MEFPGKRTGAGGGAAAAPAEANSAAPANASDSAARDALRASASSSQDAQVVDFLLDDPTRATEIAMVATNLKDHSVERINAAPPPQETGKLDPPVKPAPASGQKRRRSKTPADTAYPDEDDTPSKGKPRNYRAVDEENPFVRMFPTSKHKLGAATTISAIIIQGPFQKEDRRDKPDQRRLVLSAMRNVAGDKAIADFLELEKKEETAMHDFCLMRVESARVTTQRAVASLQKYLNATFFNALGVKPEWRGESLAPLLHRRCQLNFRFVCAAYFGLEAGQSILDRWKNDDGSHRFPALFPEELKQKVYPCKTEDLSKPVVFLVGNLMRLDARHPYRDGQGHDLMRTGNRPLAFFSPTSPPYSAVGCHLLVDFWFKQSHLGPLSKEIACTTVLEVEIVLEKTWKM